MSKFDLKTLKIIRKQECDLDETDASSLNKLLRECFSDCFTSRIFYKQIPTMRLMAFYDNTLVGQVGIDHRVISVDNHPHSIFGIVDLCVTQAFRKKGIGASLLIAIETLATQCGVHHMIAFADHNELYKTLNYTQVRAKIRFLAIEDLRSHSVIERDVSKILFIKSSKPVDFTDQTIDLLGHLF